MTATAPKAGDRDLGTEALASAKQDGRSNHETLYGNLVRRLFKSQILGAIFIAVFLWDRWEISLYTHDKLVSPVVIREDHNGLLDLLGAPDPTWKPDDRNIIAELDRLIETIRGRTVDAQHDQKQWAKVLNRCTERGCNNIAGAYGEMEKVPEKGRIVVKITSWNKSTDNTFHYTWQEERQNESGSIVPPLHTFRGTFNVVIDVPKTLDMWTKNPSGVWNDGFSIQEER